MKLSCSLGSDDLTFTINVVVHVLILFTFLTMFFVFFVSKLTKEMFEKEISHLIGDNVGDLVDKLDEETKQNLKLFTKVIPLDKLVKKFEEPSEYVLEHNRWVNLSAIAIAIVGVVVLGLVLYILYNTCGQCVPLRHILMENAIVFACVGVVEYLFFTRIALKFVPAPPSLLVSSLINKFKNSVIENTL
jgi:uncharacterized membrane protein YqhA